jgi:hypothetical protein
MDKVLGIAVIVMSLAANCFAGTSSYPELDRGDIARDLIGKKVDDWKFEKDDHKAIWILDVHYGEDRAQVHVYIQVIDGGGNHGRKGRLRLYYKWTEKDWHLINIEPLVFEPW